MVTGELTADEYPRLYPKAQMAGQDHVDNLLTNYLESDNLPSSQPHAAQTRRNDLKQLCYRSEPQPAMPKSDLNRGLSLSPLNHHV